MVVVALALAGWFGRPAYRRYKANRSLQQARVFMAGGDVRSAALSLHTVLAIEPSNLEACRLMANLADGTQSPDALAWRKRVLELAPTLDNKIFFAATALRVERPPFPLTAQTLAEVQSQAASNTAYHLVASQLALKLNRVADAEAHLEAAAALEPTNRLHRLNLATLRLQSADTNVAAAARGELASLTGDPLLGLPALRSLITYGVLRKEYGAAENFCVQLLARPQAGFDDQLLQLTVLREAGSAAFKPTLARVEETAGTNAIWAAQTVSWMAAHDLGREALDWLGTLPEAIRTTMPVPLVEADCYVGLKDWTGLEARLNGQRWEEQDFLRLALLARALREQKREEIAHAVWSRAVGAASGRNEFLVMLVQLAGTWGWTQETEDLLWTIARRSPSEDWALKNLFQQYTARGDTAGLYRVYQALLERRPDSVEAKNNVAALGLLLGRDTTRAGGLAKEVYEAAKTNAIYVSTYAFALHEQGSNAEGLKLMQVLPQTELERPNIAAYYAVLLTAAGEKEKAQPYFARAEKAQLLPEERKLVTQARGLK